MPHLCGRDGNHAERVGASFPARDHLFAPLSPRAANVHYVGRRGDAERLSTMPQTSNFHKPSPVERIFNRLFGAAISIGLGLGHNYVVEVKGRKSGTTYSTPIDLLEMGTRRYLVAPRGETNWVRNARAAGHVTLRKGGRRHEFALREVPESERPPLLKAYLDRFALTVQRYFPPRRGAPESNFASIADQYPVFELITDGDSSGGASGRG